MSLFDIREDKLKEVNIKSNHSHDWTYKSPATTPRPGSPTKLKSGKSGEGIFNHYIELIKSKSNISNEAKYTEHIERPFDFFDDEEFAFGINLLKNNIACVGDNMTKLIQMAQEPWPENVKLYQPYEVEQILLPDNASCLAVQAFLKMCDLPFEVEMRWNAEFMSPSGRVPFIKCGAFVVSELEYIAQFAANKGVTLCSKLTTEERAEMRAYMSLITNVLVNAELYISWLDQETFNAVTRVRNSSVYPWPLGWIQTRSKRAAVVKRLKALHWHDKTLEQVLLDVEQCCNSLSQRLGDKDFFFGTPTALDALVYGHLRALLSATGPRASLMIKPITGALLRHLLRMSDLTGLTLTAREEYLVCQGCQMCALKLVSPEEAATRSRRSRICVTTGSYDHFKCARDIFGFKPFASKQVIVMSNEGNIKCDYNRYRFTNVIDDKYRFLFDILDEIIDRVVVLVAKNVKKFHFDVVAYSNDFENIDRRVNDYLDTIEENSRDTTEMLGNDEIQIIETGTASDVHVRNRTVCSESTLNQDIFDLNDMNSEILSGGLIKNDECDSVSVANEEGKVFYELPVRGNDSASLLDITREEKISVEALLRYLRERNADYNEYVTDLD